MTVGHLPGALGPLTAAARAVWFVAWSALAGATAWGWIFGPSRSLAPAQAAATRRLWLRALELGWPWVAEATLLLFVATLFGAATSTTPAGEVVEAGVSWLGLAVVLALLRRPIHRMVAAEADDDSFERDLVAVTWLVPLLAAAEVATTRTPTKAPELVRIAVDGTHLAAAGVWLGTLALFVVLLRSAEWRAAATTGAPARPVVRPVVEASARSAALLIGSGVLAAAISSPGLGHWATEYSLLLAAKAAAVVVAAAIAWRQWVVVHSRAPLRRTLGSMVVEGGALVAAVTLAAILVGVDPAPPAGASSPAARAAATAPVTPACMQGEPGTDCDPATVDSVIAASGSGDLDATLQRLCTAGATGPKTYAYVACLEEVGRALASLDGDVLTPALDHCTALPEAWAEQQCGAGAIYEALQHGAPAASDAAPTWPCDTIAETFKSPCYLGVGARLLVVEHGDATAGFAVCAGVASQWLGYCDQGIGRALAIQSEDVSVPVVELCAKAGALGSGPCIIGAVRTLVYDGHGAAATSLCAAVAPADRAACDDQRTAATAQL